MRLWVVALALVACQPPCYPADYPNYTSYKAPEAPMGDEDRILLDRVVECLEPLKESWLSPQEATEAGCYGQPAIEVRSCLKIAVPEDYYVSKCSQEQVFPCSAPNASCEAKGQTPTKECPCQCRAIIQDNSIVWATPNRKLLAAYLTTLLTGCINPWTPTLAKCSNIKP